MKKNILFIAILLLVFSASAQKKLNPLIGKKEIETSFLSIVDDHLFFGGQLTYRLPLKKSLKIGIGGLYGIDYDDPGYLDNPFGYGAVFADMVKFVGVRQKWSFGGQIGHGFYNRDVGSGSIPLVAGIYYSISPNYRAIISRKILITTALVIGYRNFHYKNSQWFGVRNTEFLGIKAGIVF